MTRIACGRTIRPMVWAGVKPSAVAASVWPLSTDEQPARTISAM